MNNRIHGELVYRALEFQKRSQLFIGAHDETISVTVRIHNPICLSQSRDIACRCGIQTMNAPLD